MSVPSGGGGPSGALFEDDFAGGQLNSDGEFNWGATNIGSGDGTITFVEDVPSGQGLQYCISFNNSGTAADIWLEQRLNWTTPIDPLYIGFWFKLDANFSRQSSSDINNKICYAWSGNDSGYNDTATNVVTGMEYYQRTTDGPTDWGTIVDDTRSSAVHQGYVTYFEESDRGLWMHFVIRLQMGSIATDTGNGRAQVWKKYVGGSHTEILDVTTRLYRSGITGYRNFYLNGWANSNWQNQISPRFALLQLADTDIWGLP